MSGAHLVLGQESHVHALHGGLPGVEPHGHIATRAARHQPQGQSCGLCRPPMPYGEEGQGRETRRGVCLSLEGNEPLHVNVWVWLPFRIAYERCRPWRPPNHRLASSPLPTPLMTSTVMGRVTPSPPVVVTPVEQVSKDAPLSLQPSETLPYPAQQADDILGKARDLVASQDEITPSRCNHY